jgi:hypothetical protein
MACRPPPDLAVKINDQLQEIQSVFEEADEVYRRFRSAIFADRPNVQTGFLSKWIPDVGSVNGINAGLGHYPFP